MALNERRFYCETRWPVPHLSQETDHGSSMQYRDIIIHKPSVKSWSTPNCLDRLHLLGKARSICANRILKFKRMNLNKITIGEKCSHIFGENLHNLQPYYFQVDLLSVTNCFVCFVPCVLYGWKSMMDTIYC